MNHKLYSEHLDDIGRMAGKLVAWGIMLIIAAGYGVGLAALWFD